MYEKGDMNPDRIAEALDADHAVIITASKSGDGYTATCLHRSEIDLFIQPDKRHRKIIIAVEGTPSRALCSLVQKLYGVTKR